MVFDLNGGWVFVAIIVIVIFIVVALVQKRQGMVTNVIKFLSIFVVLTIGYIFIVNNIQMNSMQSIMEGFKIYFHWLTSFTNKAVDIGGYVIKQNWTANSTLIR